MRTLAIINQKGGVGKTTTAVNLCAALARSGRSVGLIDLDPQAHATLHLGLAEAGDSPSIYDVLSGDVALGEVFCEVAENLSVAGSHIDLAAAEMELAGVVGRELILRDQLAELNERFDDVVIDCPPSLGILTLNALCAVREVLLPLQPHYLALHGLSKLLQTLDLVSHRLNDRLQLTGVVLCMYDQTRLAAEVAENIEAYFADARAGQGTPWQDAQVFTTRIRKNIRLAEAPSHGQAIFDYAPDSHGAADYESLAEEVLATLPEEEKALVAAECAI